MSYFLYFLFIICSDSNVCLNHNLFYSNPNGACATMAACSNLGDSKELVSCEKMCDKAVENIGAGEFGHKEKYDVLTSSFDSCDFTEIKRIRLDSSEKVGTI